MVKVIIRILLIHFFSLSVHAAHIDLDTIEYQNDWYQNSYDTYVIKEKRPINQKPVLSMDMTTDKTGDKTEYITRQTSITVYFSLGSSLLQETELQKFNTLSPKDSVIESVTGYTCQIGNSRTNEQLAMDRAVSVAQKLKQDGFTIKKIQGRGNCCFLSDTRLDHNRRVEILFQEVVNPSGL